MKSADLLLSILAAVSLADKNDVRLQQAWVDAALRDTESDHTTFAPFTLIIPEEKDENG